MERLEEYSAHHAASFEEVGNWPARRFEAAWASHVARRALDALDTDQRMMIQVVLASGSEEPQEKIAEVQQHFSGLRERIIRWHEDGIRDDAFYEETDDDLVQEQWW